MSAGSSLFSWERVSLAKCVFSQILWIGTLFKKREDARSTSCVFHLCIYKQFYIIQWRIPPKVVFFTSSVDFSSVYRLSTLLLFICRIPDTFGQTDKVMVTFDSIPEVFGQCRGVLHPHNGFKTKEEVVVAQQTWGFYCPGIAAISPASSRSAPVVNALLMFTKACVDGRLW